MNTFSKYIKTASDDDRLSNLPECILCHILSFLHTKDAAKTSILSNRWRYLFLAVPKIDLVDCSTSGLKRALVHFINRRLMLCRTTSITSFRLRCGKLPEASLLHLWLTTLVFRNVQVLEIELSSRILSTICLLNEHIAWESLMVLKLVKLYGEEDNTFKLPELVLFPNLKVLHLHYVVLQSQSSDTYEFSDKAYPQLEDLRLEHITYGDEISPNLLHISLSTLKKLAIETLFMGRELSLLDIYSPQLQHLELQVRLDGQYCFAKLLSKVNSVKELDLLGSSAEGLVDCIPLPQFPNLIHLKIETPVKQLLWNVLQHSPKLEALDIEVYGDRDYPGRVLTHHTFESCCPHPENVPPCFSRTLRKIYISAFNQTEAEIEAVGFILQHGVVLQRLILHNTRGQWKFSTSKRLLKLKRSSPNCEIELV